MGSTDKSAKDAFPKAFLEQARKVLEQEMLKFRQKAGVDDAGVAQIDMARMIGEGLRDAPTQQIKRVAKRTLSGSPGIHRSDCGRRVPSPGDKEVTNRRFEGWPVQ